MSPTSSLQSFPIDEAQIVGLFMESVFYGCVLSLTTISVLKRWRRCCVRVRYFYCSIFLVTFLTCLKALVLPGGHFNPWNSRKRLMLLAAVLMFIIASLDVAFHLRHNLEVFINSNQDPVEDFKDTSNWINVMGMACYVAQTFIGDCILIYRCWIIYNRRWLVVAPSMLLWIGTLACGIMTVYYEATIKENDDLLEAHMLVPFITSMLTLTLAMNVLTTSLMVWRIRSIRNEVKHRTVQTASSPLDDVVRLLIETGLAYTISVIILFCSYIAGNNAQYGVSDAIVQIIGITFNLIITRIDRGQVTSPPSQSVRSAGTSVQLHNAINIHTTVTSYTDSRGEGGKYGSAPDVRSSTLPQSPGGRVKVDWDYEN